MIEDVAPRQAWDMLQADTQAQLVDVRTEAEWQQVGLPDLEEVGKQVHRISWQYPSGAVNPAFVEDLHRAGLRTEQSVLFLCRSGVRSLAAAEAAQAAGFAASFNVADGFEGPPDLRGRRGSVAGWQADGLPWQR